MTLLKVGKFQCAADPNCNVTVFLLHSTRRGYVIDYEHDNKNTFELSESYDSLKEAEGRFLELAEEELDIEDYEYDIY
jgi:hypothetical protein